MTESRREKSSWCVFLFPKVNICYHKLTHSWYAHITPTILCNNTHTHCMQAFILKIVEYMGTKFDCENFGGGIMSLVPRPCLQVSVTCSSYGKALQHCKQWNTGPRPERKDKFEPHELCSGEDNCTMVAKVSIWDCNNNTSHGYFPS